MRIAAKRLRYILEVGAEPCFGPYATTAIKRTKELQDLLGELHDCDVQLPRVRALQDELRAADALEARAPRRRRARPRPDAGLGHAARARPGAAWRRCASTSRRAAGCCSSASWSCGASSSARASARACEYAISERPEPPTPLSPSDNGDHAVGRRSLADAAAMAEQQTIRDVPPPEPEPEPEPDASDLDDPRLYNNRELSWIEFNARVLELAEQDDMPLHGAPEVPGHLHLQPRRVLHHPRRRACTTRSTPACTTPGPTAARRRRSSTSCASASSSSTSARRAARRTRCARRWPSTASASSAMDEVGRRGARARSTSASGARSSRSSRRWRSGSGARSPTSPTSRCRSPSSCATRRRRSTTFARVKVPKEMLPRFVPAGDGAPTLRRARGAHRGQPRRALPRAWRSSTTASSASRATPTSTSPTRPTTCCAPSRPSCAAGASARSCASRSTAR